MKKHLFTLLFSLAFTVHVLAQWLPNGATTGNIYYNNGNIGIGTNNPLGTLHVNPVRPIIMKYNGGNGVYGSEIGFNAVLNTSVTPNEFKKLGGTSQQGGASMIADYQGNLYFQMYNAGTESESVIQYKPQITFQNTGFVGLGITSPQTMFNINQGAGDAITGTPALRIGGTGNYPSLEFGIKGAYDGMISTYGNDLHLYSGNWRVAGAVASENHNISFYTSQANSVNWNTPKMYLRYDGNFGIGTSSPNRKLHVSALDASVQQRFERTGSSAGITDVGVDNQGLKFFIGGYESPSLKALFGSNGKVGIGTFSPDAELTVNGTTHTKEVKVDLSIPGPDYVFEESYALPTLEEVKSYIDQNKHLPEVPSAKEMEANGVNLGEMNMLLLKKIEELTLYVIEQNKNIQFQNEKAKKHGNEIEFLKNEIQKIRKEK
jgi:hypothetical protein